MSEELREFEVEVRRFEMYTGTATVRAASRKEAREQVRDQLNEGGWGQVFPGDDGDLEECWTEVVGLDDADSVPDDDKAGDGS